MLAALAPLSVSADSYTIDSARSRIAFSVRHLLGTARGEFHKFSGTIEVDANQPEQSSASVKIEVASLDTKIQKRDKHLLSAEFFDAKQFPEITFRSRSVKRTGPYTGDVVGDFTMHGITRPLILQVKLLTPNVTGKPAEPTRWLVSVDPIRRKDFGLMFGKSGEAVSGIGREITAAIEIEATPR